MKENTEELEILAQSVINTEELEILAQSVINGEKIEEVVSNPVIGLLFSVLKSFIPVLDISEPIVQTFFQKREKEKIISLLEGISNAPISNIPLERLNQSNAIEEWCLICDAVQKIASKKKIRTLGRLYSNTYLGKDAPEVGDDDLFEEWVSALTDMSDREIDILLTLRKYEVPHFGQEKTHYSIAESIWSKFENDIIQRYNLSKEEFYPIMQRLLRTGFYRNDLAEVGALDRGADKMGYTTEYFSKFFMKAVGTEEKALQAPARFFHSCCLAKRRKSI